MTANRVIVNVATGSRYPRGQRRLIESLAPVRFAGSVMTWQGLPTACATTAFGVSLCHPIGIQFLKGFYRFASETRAFHGPWINFNCPEQMASRNVTEPDGFVCAVCGPPEVRGHRHDQTVASVIARWLGINLDRSRLMAYKGAETPETALVADGGYE